MDLKRFKLNVFLSFFRANPLKQMQTRKPAYLEPNKNSMQKHRKGLSASVFLTVKKTPSQGSTYIKGRGYSFRALEARYNATKAFKA